MLVKGLVLFVADGISLIVVCEQSFSLYPSETALREVSYANGQIGGDHVGGQGFSGRMLARHACGPGVIRVDRSSRLDGWLESAAVAAVGKLSTQIS